MLPVPDRLRRPADFKLTITRGQRIGRQNVVIYLRPTGQAPRAGFVVSKAVGSAVIRNRVKRRLRHLVAQRLDRLAGADVVVRALPPAAGARQQLAVDVESAWCKAERLLAANQSTTAAGLR